MNRKLGSVLIGAAIITGGVTTLVATQNAAGAARTTAGQHIVMDGHATLTAAGKGLFYLKLHSAIDGTGKLTSRIAVSSITLSQFGGSQAITVAIRAATCDNANGFGALEQVVVPQDETVHLTYPSAVRMPLVANTPSSYCLYAETLRDNGRLDVSVVATTL
jgi:hypothetical protein